MRKIHKELLTAVYHGRPWRKANLRVEPSTFNGQVEGVHVYLHNNSLGMYSYTAGKFIPALETLKRYPTRTTCSYLRTLGIGAHIVRGAPRIDDVPV